MSSADEAMDQLRSAMTTNRDDGPSWTSAIRLRASLQPAGGPGAKVMPPTYASARSGEPPIYIEEARAIDGTERRCVSLDSVASQANRGELALADEIERGNAHVPTVWVDQGEEFGTHSALEFSHRVFDAWIEDALLDDERFGNTEIWRRIAASRRHDLTALFLHSPTAIVLGSWASRLRSPQGAARLARILTSEILAVGAVTGRRAKGKRDIHDVSNAIPIYEPADGSKDRIAIDPRLARTDGTKPAPFKEGKPSSAGYGSVVPGVADSGGITMEYALQIATISLPALRECRFPAGDAGDCARDVSGRLMLAALALRLIALQVERGYDLRSDCLLVPDEPPTFELIDRIGRPTARWDVLELDTDGLLRAATEAGKASGLDWSEGDIHLEASAIQRDLLRGSLAHRAAAA
jgi:CRISPR-associated protein Csb1